jgi:hypothetical protein
MCILQVSISAAAMTAVNPMALPPPVYYLRVLRSRNLAWVSLG